LKIAIPPLLRFKLLSIRYMALRHGGTLTLEVNALRPEERRLLKGLRSESREVQLFQLKRKTTPALYSEVIEPLSVACAGE
jgi:hypothetical protein